MSKSKKIIALILALACVFSLFSVMASAKKAAAPAIKLEVATDKTCTNTLGKITVTVTATNTSKKDVKNVVITSADSEGLVTKKATHKNVLITNPGAPDLEKKDSMTTCLKPGGKITYKYFVYLGYEYSTRRIPESVHRIMYTQHKLLGLNYFRKLDISSGKAVMASGKLTFGDVGTKLIVKAFYNISNADYDYIISEYAVSTDSSENNGESGSSSRQSSRATAAQE